MENCKELNCSCNGCCGGKGECKNSCSESIRFGFKNYTQHERLAVAAAVDEARAFAEAAFEICNRVYNNREENLGKDCADIQVMFWLLFRLKVELDCLCGYRSCEVESFERSTTELIAWCNAHSSCS